MFRYLVNPCPLSATLARQSFGRYLSFAFTALVCLLAFGNSAWSQCALEKLTAHDGESGDRFGSSVYVSGEYALSGAWAYDGIGNFSGAVYVYRFDAERKSWIQQQILEASDAQLGQFGDGFGFAVYINDDVAVIGAPGDDEACPNSPKFCNSGSAYVFRYDPDTSKWIEEDKLFASDGDVEDNFGSSVSISGNVVIVGVHLDDDDDFGINSGSAYIFRKDPKSNDWVEEVKLTAPDANTEGSFGTAVAIQGNVAVIIGLDTNDDPITYNGTAYVYQYDPKTGQWNEDAMLTASDAEFGDFFNSVSFKKDLIVIGAAGDDDAAANTGAVYVFRYDAKTKLWNEVDKLTASDAEDTDRFGWSVSLSNDLILVGAFNDDDACPKDPDCDSGSAYLFQYDPKSDSWLEKAKLTASDPGFADEFGWSLSISGNLAIVGAQLDDEMGPNAGAAYAFDLSACLCPADLDGDGIVNTSDLLALFAQWGKNPNSPADLNSDGTVNTADLLILFANWGLCQ